MPRTAKPKAAPAFENVTIRMNADQRGKLEDLAQRFAAKHGIATGVQSQIVRLLIERYGDQFAKDEGI